MLVRNAADKPRISFLAFFLLWAERMRWQVPPLHVRVCQWLQEAWLSGEPWILLMLPRGHAKSTILAIFNAWLYYCHPPLRMLHQSESDGTAYKTSRDTQNVLRHHPLTAGMLPAGQGTVEQWWVTGAQSLDPRNASMYAKGILSNVTSSRADFIQNDDIEVPKNIGTPEAREKLRYRLGEQVHIAVPGAPKLYIGTPHTHDSIYEDIKRLGARSMVVRMFDQSHRIESASKARYAVKFEPEYVFTGIGEGAALLEPGRDYTFKGGHLIFPQPPACLVDCYAGAAWPERFTRGEMRTRRQECRTLNEWDSQYQLHAKPVAQVRLDPDRITPYDCELQVRHVNNTISLWLGEAKIAGVAMRWDPSSGKMRSDVSAAAVVLQDEFGRRYIHRVAKMTGDVAEFDAGGKKIIGGQVYQLADLIEEMQIPRITIENNGIGGFGPAVMKAALKQRRLLCGVAEQASTANKNKRILESLEPLLLARDQIWAHVGVLDGPFYEQLRDWNPALPSQPDDYVDVVASACSDVPERVGQIVGNPTPKDRKDWRPSGGVFEIATDH